MALSRNARTGALRYVGCVTGDDRRTPGCATVTSGLAAVMVATSPFWMATVESLLPDGERLRRGVVADDWLSRCAELMWQRDQMTRKHRLTRCGDPVP